MRKQLELKKWIIGIVLGVMAVIAVSPLYILLISSFKTQHDMINNPFGLPETWVFSYYVSALQKMDYLKVLWNNIWVTGLTVFLIVIFSSMASYGIAHLRPKAGKFFYVLFLAGVMIPYQVAILSLFKVVRGLGLINSLFSVVVVFTFTNLSFPIFMMTSFLKTIPIELEQAALIDGCTPFMCFRKIIFPLLKPTCITVALLNALAVWNEYFTPSLFLPSSKGKLLSLELARNIGVKQTDWMAMYAMMVLVIAPFMIIFLIMQKQIMKGVVAGSVKE